MMVEVGYTCVHAIVIQNVMNDTNTLGFRMIFYCTYLIDGEILQGHRVLWLLFTAGLLFVL
jgi:hypothetical protein